MGGLLGIVAFIGCRLLLGLALVIGLLWLVFASALAAPSAQASKAPLSVLPADFVAFRNVVETGDLFVVGRYNLPDDGTGTWDEFGESAALARLIQTAPPSLQDRTPPSLGHALASFYLEPGHGALWGSTDLFVRFQGNPGLFEDVSEQDRAITFSAPGADSSTLVIDSEDRQNALCDVFSGQLEDLQQADPDLGSGDLISGGIITEAGTAVAIAAFSGAASLLPQCFTVGQVGSGEAFDPSDPALRDNLITEVEATSWWSSWTTLVGHWGMAGNEALVASVFIVMAAFGVMIALSVVTQSVVFGTVAGVITILGGALWVPHFLLQVVMVLIAIATVLAMGFWWARVPRG